MDIQRVEWVGIDLEDWLIRVERQRRGRRMVLFLSSHARNFELGI
jgi:hypothetical protein